MDYIRITKNYPLKRAKRAHAIIPTICQSQNPAFTGQTDIWEIPDGHQILQRWIITGLIIGVPEEKIRLDILYYGEDLYTSQFFSGDDVQKIFTSSTTMRPAEFLDVYVNLLVRPVHYIILVLDGVEIEKKFYRRN